MVSAADGKVSGVERVAPPRELGLADTQLTRISVFLSVLDVHIVRAPVAGKVVRSIYVPGKFLNAELDKASEENERRAMVIETATGEAIGVVLIAGLVARRIVTFLGEGTSVTAGERIGLIRFGSRVDVYVPVGAQCPGHGRPDRDRRRDGACRAAERRNREPRRAARLGLLVPMVRSVDVSSLRS